MENIVNEIWVEIKDFPVYQISNRGRVKSFKNNSETILKGSSTGNGYYNVVLLYNNLRRRVRIHVLVAEYFIENPLLKRFVNHINGKKRDNRVENLEWCTSSENNQHAYDTGLKNRSKCGTRDLDHPKARAVIKMDMDGNFIQEYAMLKLTGFANRARIANCCNGKRVSYAGFKWKWPEN